MANAITVHCPSCETAFPVDPEKVPEGGVNARCSECSDIFRVDDPGAPAGWEPEADSGWEAEAEESSWEPDETGADVDTAFAEPEAEIEPEPEIEPDDYFASTGVSAPVEEEGEETQEVEPAEEETAAETDVEFGTEIEVEPPVDTDVAAETEVEAVPEAESAPARPAFGSRTPEQKAERLARVLVSDMITYNPQMYERALEQGTLEEDFADEIEKSWEEYVDQVGKDLAESTSYWKDALNDILAKGDDLF